MDILIVGGGIGGLTLALNLHAVGLSCTVCEAAPDILPLGVGINLMPHAGRILTELGLQEAVARVAMQPTDYAFFTRNGQLVYREPWGYAAGHKYPHFSVHRAELHRVLLDATIERLGAGCFVTGHRCMRIEQDEHGATALFVAADGSPLPPRRADVIIACDGIHSAVRQQFYPDEGPPVFHGINLWRGVTRARPFLTGTSIARVGATHSTMMIYPIRDDIDGTGTQLINWVAEVETTTSGPVDWSKPGRLEDFYPIYQDWTFDWLDVAALIRNADFILSYPMVDRDPVERWTFGRVTLLGDAAHPMYPRGGNGGAQAMLDTVALARCLKGEPDVTAALRAYEAERRPATTRVVEMNRTAPPNVIVDTVEKLTGGKRFDRLEDVIGEGELKAIFERYQRVAGYHVDQVGRSKS